MCDLNLKCFYKISILVWWYIPEIYQKNGGQSIITYKGVASNLLKSKLSNLHTYIIGLGLIPDIWLIYIAWYHLCGWTSGYSARYSVIYWIPISGIKNLPDIQYLAKNYPALEIPWGVESGIFVLFKISCS